MIPTPGGGQEGGGECSQGDFSSREEPLPAYRASAAQGLFDVIGLRLNTANALFSLWEVSDNEPGLHYSQVRTGLHNRVPPHLILILQPAWPPEQGTDPGYRCDIYMQLQGRLSGSVG